MFPSLVKQARLMCNNNLIRVWVCLWKCELKETLNKGLHRHIHTQNQCCSCYFNERSHVFIYKKVYLAMAHFLIWYERFKLAHFQHPKASLQTLQVPRDIILRVSFIVYILKVNNTCLFQKQLIHYGTDEGLS